MLLNKGGSATKKLEEPYNSINGRGGVESDLVCLTETRETFYPATLFHVTLFRLRRRDVNDKKGGGVAIQMVKDNLHGTDCLDQLFLFIDRVMEMKSATFLTSLQPVSFFVIQRITKETFSGRS